MSGQGLRLAINGPVEARSHIGGLHSSYRRAAAGAAETQRALQESNKPCRACRGHS